MLTKDFTEHILVEYARKWWNFWKRWHLLLTRTGINLHVCRLSVLSVKHNGHHFLEYAEFKGVHFTWTVPGIFPASPGSWLFPYCSEVSSSTLLIRSSTTEEQRSTLGNSVKDIQHIWRLHFKCQVCLEKNIYFWWMEASSWQTVEMCESHLSTSRLQPTTPIDKVSTNPLKLLGLDITVNSLIKDAPNP